MAEEVIIAGASGKAMTFDTSLRRLLIGDPDVVGGPRSIRFRDGVNSGTLLYDPATDILDLTDFTGVEVSPKGNARTLQKKLKGMAVPSSNAYILGGFGTFQVQQISDSSSALSYDTGGLGRKFNSTSAATTGTETTWSESMSVSSDLGALPYIRTKVDIGSVTTVRWFIGWHNAANAATAVGSADPAAYQCAFQFDTTQSDTNWYAVTDNNGTQRRTDTGVAAATGVYSFEIDVLAADSVRFRIEDSTNAVLYDATIAEDIPAFGNAMSFVQGVETQDNVAVTQGIFYLELYGP